MEEGNSPLESIWVRLWEGRANIIVVPPPKMEHYHEFSSMLFSRGGGRDLEENDSRSPSSRFVHLPCPLKF